MEEKKKGGGPAFPVAASMIHHNGMTLREYFAAAATIGMLAANKEDHYAAPEASTLAKCAFSYADALLKERDNSK